MKLTKKATKRPGRPAQTGVRQGRRPSDIVQVSVLITEDLRCWAAKQPEGITGVARIGLEQEREYRERAQSLADDDPFGDDSVIPGWDDLPPAEPEP